MSNFKLLSSLLLVCLVESVTSQQCNECNTTTGYACFSDNQYFGCDSTGVDISSLTSCSSGICDNTDTSSTSPCSPTSAPTCPQAPISTQAPKTTTTEATTTTESTTTTEPTTTTGSTTTTTASTTTPETTTTTTSPTTTSTATTSASTSTTSTSTATTSATTTTTSAPFSAFDFCASRAVGRYAIPNQPGCLQYCYCYLNNGLKGAVYNCTGETFYNPSSKGCDPNYTCPT